MSVRATLNGLRQRLVHGRAPCDDRETWRRIVQAAPFRKEREHPLATSETQRKSKGQLAVPETNVTLEPSHRQRKIALFLALSLTCTEALGAVFRRIGLTAAYPEINVFVLTIRVRQHNRG